MRLVRFENTAFNYPMAFVPTMIEEVRKYTEEPELTGLRITGAKVVVNVKYDYETTCDMIDEALIT